MSYAGTSIHPPENIEAALTALALNNGNARLAHEALKEQGIDISERTLHRYRTTPRYAELHDQRKTEIEQAAIRQWREITVTGAQTQLAATQRAYDQIHDLDAKDAAAVAKNIAIATGVAADKLLVFTDRPNVIHSTPEPTQLLQQFARTFGFDAPIDSTAEPIPPTALMAESDESNPRENPSDPA